MKLISHHLIGMTQWSRNPVCICSFYFLLICHKNWSNLNHHDKYIVMYGPQVIIFMDHSQRFQYHSQKMYKQPANCTSNWLTKQRIHKLQCKNGTMTDNPRTFCPPVLGTYSRRWTYKVNTNKLTSCAARFCFRIFMISGFRLDLEQFPALNISEVISHDQKSWNIFIHITKHNLARIQPERQIYVLVYHPLS